MMKKLIRRIVVCCMIFLLCGCGNQADNNSQDTSQGDSLNKEKITTGEVKQKEEKVKISEADIPTDFGVATVAAASAESVSTSEELDLMIKYKGTVYTVSGLDVDIDTDNLTKIGKIKSIVSADKKPSKNSQANRNIKGAIIYKGEENSIIVKIKDEYKILEK